jgi:small multidrug resistance pump
MPAGFLLTLAILTEVVATLCMRASDGFTRLVPSVVVVVGYAISFWLMAQVLREFSSGFTYAVWSGAGTAIVAVFGILVWDESAAALKIASLALIIVGVIGLNLAPSN